MKNLNHQSLQFQLENLIPILELWIDLLEETKKTQITLEELPAQLKYLKQQINVANRHKYGASTGNQQQGGEVESQEVDFKL